MSRDFQKVRHRVVFLKKCQRFAFLIELVEHKEGRETYTFSLLILFEFIRVKNSFSFYSIFLFFVVFPPSFLFCLYLARSFCFYFNFSLFSTFFVWVFWGFLVNPSFCSVTFSHLNESIFVPFCGTIFPGFRYFNIFSYSSSCSFSFFLCFLSLLNVSYSFSTFFK